MSESSSKKLEGFIRAFWRRIEPYKNEYGKELPSELPLEFKVHAATAELLLKSNDCEDSGIKIAARKIRAEIDATESEHGHRETDTNSFIIDDSRSAYIEGLEFALGIIENSN